ncbi:MAG: LPS-assembly protein LptD [Wenzhouxiangella sp.]
MSRLHLFPLILTIALLPIAAAWGQGMVIDSDRPALSCLPPEARLERIEPERGEDIPVQIDAEFFSAERGEPIIARDQVRVAQGDRRLQTEEIIFDRDSGRLDLPVLLNYRDAYIAIRAERAWVESQDSRGRFEQVGYRIAESDGAGQALVIDLLSPSRAELEEFDFTTCDPADPDWQLKAGRVRLDLDKGQGIARHARLEFKGVPILYSPWLSFPLNDERQSGFLYPQIGFSSDDGFDLRAPWYWNIAPNQDATFTPRWIQDRGTMLAAEYRFLTPTQRGELELEFLPSDRRADRNRYYGQFDYRATLAPGWWASVNARRASDNDYFVDLGGELEDSAVQFLRSSAQVRGRGRLWSISVLADTFQVLDEAVSDGAEPYRRLPRIRAAYDRPLPGNLDFGLDSELVYFDRDAGVTGARFDLYPRLRWNFLRSGGFLRPELGLRTTAYHLEDAASDSVTRTTPIASIDGGLVFERPLAAGDRIQTLEPRLFYLYVPTRDQDEIPRFDTAELTFGFSQLFHYNRFSGPDRQADANQLTLALTSRLIDTSDGRSPLDFSLGQIVYFSDLEVQLPGRPIDRRSRSATVAEINWRPRERLALSAGLQWDSVENETEVAQLGLNYRGRNARQYALGYRFRRDRLDQVDLRVRYPVRPNMNLIGRVNYSFEESQALEVLGGIEFESCCWAVRVTAREFIRDRDAATRRAVFLELHLKGLGSLGRRPYPLFSDQR